VVDVAMLILVKDEKVTLHDVANKQILDRDKDRSFELGKGG
jgi:hypothetical protein